MYCKYCGSEIEDGAVFCGVCGGRQVSDPTAVSVQTSAPVQTPAPSPLPVNPAPMPTSPQGMATVSRPAKRVVAEAGSVSGTYTSAKKKSFGIRTKEIAIVATVAVLLVGGIAALAILNPGKDKKSDAQEETVVAGNSDIETGAGDDGETIPESEGNEEDNDDKTTVTGTDGIEYELSDDGQTLEISGKGTVKDVFGDLNTEQINRIKTVIIGDEVFVESSKLFYGCDQLEHVKLPATMTVMDFGCFSSCYSLVSVEMPEGLKVIGDSAFNGCCSLKSIDIPDTVTRIDKMAFSVTGMTSVRIPDGVKEISAGAFRDCPDLEEVFLGNETDTICESAFQNCENLKRIDLPDSVTEIKKEAFSNCSNLSGVQLPRSLKIVGAAAFHDCTNAFDKLVIPEAVEELEVSCFAYCDGIKEVVVESESLQSVSMPFFECSNIETIFLPESMSSMENSLLESLFPKPSVEYN